MNDEIEFTLNPLSLMALFMITGKLPSVQMTLEFTADSVESLLAQLIGVCSATRFWDEMPEEYPAGAGIFLDKNASLLFEAAKKNLEKLS